jgi:hypothetical protein
MTINSFLSTIRLLVILLGLLSNPPCNTSPSPTLLSLSLINQRLGLKLLRLHRVNCLEQDTLVLELVTLGVEVESVINVPVDFLGVTHLVEETTEDTDTTHPENLEWETGVGGTATLTGSYGD